ncbi:MAG: T9SS type A sorting domain-containing protein [Bacteroidales bacterium]|nr:T9SS type A sorting domain-containing protein [Bacteroidales bacterium]
MKKALLFSFVLLFSVATMAQTRTLYLEETFDGSSLPAGWTKTGLGTSNWYISSTANAGGTANELMLYYNPTFNGTARFVSPVVDLTGVSSVVVSFKHYLDNYSGSHILGIGTTSDGGATWHDAWSQNYSVDGGYLVNQEISNTDVGSENFQFCIFYTGYSYNFDNWFFDDIQLFTLENLDLAINGHTMPDIMGTGEFQVGVKVMNYGVTPITSIEASYEIAGMAPVTQTFAVNLNQLTSTTLNFTQAVDASIPGNYDVLVRINKVNGVDDDVLENNVLEKTVSVAISHTQRIPMIEHFSSSTCGPCVSVNVQMNNFCNNNQGRFTYTKYQMNWPGNGDPYYTAEGGVRRTLYGISAVPNIVLDGQNVGTNMTQGVFNQEAQVASFMDIRGSFTVEGNTIHVKADVMPYVDIHANLFVSVNEKITTGNVGTNGETSFHHVFMKMLPNADGEPVDFVSTEFRQFEYTQNLSSTHVEEMDDLEVSIWVQILSNQEILNSHFAYEYTDAHPYPVENLTLTKENNVYTATWDAPANGSPIGYHVYVNGESVLENTTATSYTFEEEVPGFYDVEVMALYPNEMTSVKAVASVEAVEDLGLLITGNNNVVLDPAAPSAELVVTNGNYASELPIQILSVTEAENATGVPYLVITTPNELPYTLNLEESLAFVIEPNYPVADKGFASTVVTVESDAGSVEFFVEIDGELLNVTELTAETKIYPNPTNGVFTVEGSNVASVKIYNLVGQMVFEENNRQVVRIDTESWNKGIYMVSVTDQQGAVVTSKLLVK